MSGSSKSDKSKRTSPLISFVAGGVAGGCEAVATYPFEFAKTRVQLKSEGGPKNPFAVVANVFKQEGARALYTGCSAMVVGTIAKDAIRFLTFDTIKSFFADEETGAISPFRDILSGMAAGVVASTLAVTPSERVKIALIDDARSPGSKRFHSPIHAIRMLVAESGPSALYRGYVTTTLKQSGATGLRLGSYSILKEIDERYSVQQSTLISFTNGAIAGTITTYGTQPVDTIKTRAQSVRGARTLEATASIWRDYGMRGFWRGSTMRLGRNVFSGGILFTTYEWTAGLLEGVLGTRTEI